MRYIGLIIGWLCLGLSVYAQTYKVGDVIVNKDGSQGVVFWVNAEGSEGWMVALHDLPRPLKWGRLRDDVPELENVGSGSGVNELSKIFKGLADTSGYQNTLKLRKYQGSGTQYPAQLVDFGNGWYVPAAGQMRKLFTSMNSIRTVIQNRGGDALKVGRYWSSTEYDARAAWFVYCHPGELNFDTKDSVLYVRPVRSFSVRDVKYDRTLAYKWNSGKDIPALRFIPAGIRSMRLKLRRLPVVRIRLPGRFWSLPETIRRLSAMSVRDRLIRKTALTLQRPIRHIFSGYKMQAGAGKPSLYICIRKIL